MEPMAKLFDDLVGEILLRIPPEDPACLLRISLVCKRWRRILADPGFHRRHREFHRTPRVLGFLGAGAAGSCDGDPFRVVFIHTICNSATGNDTSARVYSSETGDWSELTSVQHPVAFVDHMSAAFSTLVGDMLYFDGEPTCSISYQPDVQRLSVIDRPPQSMFNGYLWLLKSMEDSGRLGFVGVEEEPSFCVRLFLRETSHDGVARWVQGRTIKLETLLPGVTLPPPSGPQELANAKVVGVAGGTDAIFVYVRTDAIGDIYMIQLNSGSAKKVARGSDYVFPYTSFCIPVMNAASSGDRPKKGV